VLLAPTPCDLSTAEALRDPDRDHREEYEQERHDVDDGEFVGPLHGVEDPDRDRLGARASREERDDDFIEREGEGEEASREERSAHSRERDATEGHPGVGTKVGGGLLWATRKAAQARHDVVVRHHNAEGGVRNDDCGEAKPNAEELEAALQRNAGDHAGERDRQDEEERDGVLPEEVVPLHRERGERAKHQRNQRCGGGGNEGVEQRRADRRIRRRLTEPVQRKASRRPSGELALVEGVDGEDDQRQIDEDEHQRGCGAQQRSDERRLNHV